MALRLKPDSASANSKVPGGRTSPSVKPKNLFTRYVDILNYNSSNLPAATASTSHVSVSDSNYDSSVFFSCLHCFDTVSWSSGRAFGL